MQTPADFQVDMFLEPMTLVPWIFGIPPVLLLLRRHCKPNVKDQLALAGQVFQALSLPYFISMMAIGTVVAVTYGDEDYSTVGGLILGWAIPGGLILALAYLITMHAGDVTLLKPVGKLHAILLMVVPWSSINAFFLQFQPSFFTKFDPVFFLFTPASFLIAYALNRVYPRPVAHSLADMAIVNSLFYVVVALTYWLHGSSASSESFEATIQLGCWGLIIGPSIYQSAYLWSLTDPQEKGVEIRTKNWHFLEIVTIFYFFLFAPESVSGIANRKLYSEDMRNVLSELRAHTNATVISLDSLSLQPKTEHLGVLCANVGNIGLRSANRLYVKPNAKLDERHTSEFEESVHIAVDDIYIANLPAGVTKRACADYRLINAETEKQVRTDFDASAVFLISSIAYEITYSEDAIARPDYRGVIGEFDTGSEHE